MGDEQVARLFHDTYEKMAPSFGYETRSDTKEFNPQSPNGQLMIAVCKVVSDALTAENAELRKVLGNLTQEVETWDACDKHNCANYRPVLPWPESEGWWWCSNGRLYEFVRHQGKFMAWWDDGDLTDSDLYSLHYPGEQAPRFTRLLEPNPFTK